MLSADFIDRIRLPSHDELFQLLDETCSVLETEQEFYRPRNTKGDTGGLIDFSRDDTPLVLIPDLHGRNHFLRNILDYRIPQSFIKSPDNMISVLEAMKKKLIRVVFVGDAMHTEKTTVYRWCEAQEDFEKNNYTGKSISAEMAENLTLLSALMKLKKAFPENFHFLKGNHENITNRNSGGDFAFRKYADEGRMVKYFIHEYYGDDILYLMSCFEDNLPLLFAGKNALISHAEPIKVFTREQVINGRLDPKVVEGLTWTDNGNAFEESCAGMFRDFLTEENITSASFFGGHRPVTENFQFRQNGKFIQFHNPLKQNIILVHTDRKFIPEEDIKGVNNG